jgi:hypothetical protein
MPDAVIFIKHGASSLAVMRLQWELQLRLQLPLPLPLLLPLTWGPRL